MKKLRFISVFSLLLLVWLSLGSLVFAQDTSFGPPDLGTGIAVKCNFFDCSIEGAYVLIDRILKWIVAISLSVATLAIVYAGIVMVLNADNDGKRKEAKEIFKLVGKGL